MSSRRKYKRDQASQVDNVAVVSPELPPAPPMAGENPAMPQPADDDALVRAAAAARHAEELQHQHAQRQQMGLQEPELDPQQRQEIDAHVDAIPNLTGHQKRFLKSHPSLMSEPYVSLMRHAILVARHAGIADDTPQMDHAILAGIARDLEHHHALSQLTAASARPTAENAQAHHDVGQAAEALQREAEGHLAAFTAENPPPPPPAPRRSIPMSAPVSRDVPSASGGRVPDRWNTLSAEERQIAHNSFTDPNMSNHEKELLYLRNRQKLHTMRTNGTYSEQKG